MLAADTRDTHGRGAKAVGQSNKQHKPLATLSAGVIPALEGRMMSVHGSKHPPRVLAASAMT